jgi:hypothetical protein
MYLKTYEKQLLSAYTNKTELYRILPPAMVPVVVDICKAWRRGLTVTQVLEVLSKELSTKNCNPDSISLTLSELKPKGKPQYN